MPPRRRAAREETPYIPPYPGLPSDSPRSGTRVVPSPEPEPPRLVGGGGGRRGVPQPSPRGRNIPIGNLDPRGGFHAQGGHGYFPPHAGHPGMSSPPPLMHARSPPGYPRHMAGGAAYAAAPQPGYGPGPGFGNPYPQMGPGGGMPHPYGHSAGMPTAPLPPHMMMMGGGSPGAMFHPMGGYPMSHPMMFAPMDPYEMGGMRGALPHGMEMEMEMARAQAMRPNANVNFDKWVAGTAYGPVLDPLQISLLDLTLEVNPLLQGPPRDDSKRAYLEYSVLYPTNSAHRSDDRPGRSWSKGRRSPATFPRVSQITLISSAFPWVIHIDASNDQHGVTCADVLNGLYEGLKKTIGRAKFESLQPRKQQEISERYHRNRSTAGPGYELGEGIKRVDYLCDKVAWDGMRVDKDFVLKKLGVAGKGWKKQEGKTVPWPAVFVVDLEVEPTGVDRDVRFERVERQRDRERRRGGNSPERAETEVTVTESET